MKLITRISALFLLSVAAQAQPILEQATASQARLIGPFVDTSGDVVTGLTIDAADVRISINGGNIAAKNSGGCTHDELGMYTCTFDATDTATVGSMQVIVDEAGALPVYHYFQIVEEAVHANFYDAGAVGPLTAAQVNAEADTALSDYDPPTNTELTTAVANVSVYELQATALADMFNTDSGTTYGSAVAGSVVAETADNAGGSALTVAAIVKGLGGHTTTIATLASQTSFTLTAGSADDNAYNGWAAYVEDVSTSTQVALGKVGDYTGSSRTVTLSADPGIFTMAATDNIILLPAFLADAVNIGTVEGTDATDYFDSLDNTLVTNLATVDGIVDTLLAGLTIESGTIGDTGNSTTAVHLVGLTYANDELNTGYTLVIFDDSDGEYHATDITDWALTGTLATVNTLPFTPEDSVDTYVLIPNAAELTNGSALTEAGGTGDQLTALATAAALATVDTNVDDIETDTNEIQTDLTDGGRLDLIFDGILVDTGTTLQGEVDGIQADTENIQTRIPASLNNGVMPADVQRINDVEITGDGSATPFDVP